MSEIILSDVVADYVSWVSDVVTLSFRKDLVTGDSWAVEKFSRFKFGHNPGDGDVLKCGVILEGEPFRIHSVKRGDERYSERLVSRVSRLSSWYRGVDTFWSLSDKRVRGSWLWLTYEMDRRRFTLEDCWLNIRKEFNRHKSWIVKRFGNVRFWSFLQAHASGYPHLHVIVEFLGHVFSGFRHFSKKGKISFRCDDKGLFSDNWSVGFVDCKMVQSVGSVMRYGARYGSRLLSKGRADLTLALGHHFKRMGFTMSRAWSRFSRGVVDHIGLPDWVVEALDVITDSIGSNRVLGKGVAGLMELRRLGADVSSLVVVRYRFLGFG